MGIFDGMNAATTGGRRYLDAGGVYQVKILKCGQKTAAEAYSKVPSFFVELEVVTSDVKSCPAGTVASWSVKFAQGEGLGAKQANVKQFLAAVLGVMTIFETPDPATGAPPNAEQIADAICSPAQPFKGRMVGVKVGNKKTKANTDFSKHDWFPAG